jgi:hypothetical protein
MVLPLVQNMHLQLSSMIQPQLDNTMLTKQTSYNFASSGLHQRSTKRPCDGILLDERPAKRLKAHGGVSIDLIDDMQAIPQVNAQLPERSKRSTKLTKRPKSCPPKKAGAKKASAKKAHGDQRVSSEPRQLMARMRALPKKRWQRLRLLLPSKLPQRALVCDGLIVSCLLTEDNEFTFQYDSPSGTTAAELNKLFNPSKLLPKGYYVSGSGQSRYEERGRRLFYWESYRERLYTQPG